MLSCNSEELGPYYIDEQPIIQTVQDGESTGPESIGPVETNAKMGTFRYSGSIPGENSKIPTCKDKKPAFVHFDLTDSKGNFWQRESPVTEVNGKWVSVPDSLPQGDYTVLETYLLSTELDTVYALPKQSETEFHDYATTILPLDIEINQNAKTIEGLAMCYVPPAEPEEGTFNPGIEFVEIMTLPIYVTAEFPNAEPGYSNCIDWIHVTIDGEIVLERFIFSGHIKYDMLIPSDYDTLSIYAYSNLTYDVEPVGIFEFTRTNPYDPEIHGALIFDECE